MQFCLWIHVYNNPSVPTLTPIPAFKQQLTNCLSVSDHFIELVVKEIIFSCRCNFHKKSVILIKSCFRKGQFKDSKITKQKLECVSDLYFYFSSLPKEERLGLLTFSTSIKL